MKKNYITTKNPTTNSNFTTNTSTTSNFPNKKANRGTYRKANIALGLSAIGLAVAYPFQGTFPGGLLTSGCSAALVGGLADWFAVNALFRRPLGVPAGKVFRTEIIPRNRERIFQALSDMVENELLSQEALKSKLEAYDFVAPALGIWSTLDKDPLESLLAQGLRSFQESLNSSLREGDLERESIALFEEESIRDGQFIPLVEKALLDLGNREEGKRVLEAILTCLSQWVQDTEVHLWLTRMLDNSIERYTQNPSRRILALFLPEPSELALNVQAQLADYLVQEETQAEVLAWLLEQVKLAFRASLTEGQDRRTEDGDAEGDAENRTEGRAVEVETESRAENKTEDGAENGAGHDFRNTKELSSPALIIFNKLREYFMANLIRKLQAPESPLVLSKQLLRRLEVETASLEDNPEKRQRFNQAIQGLLLSLLENKHQKIGDIVHEGLEKYSNEMLVELIESKAGDDLQMIRINGSVVGGLAGMLIYLGSLLFF